jgi:hypothetical protein
VNDGEPRARYPNEPAGYVTWFEHDWQSWPGSGQSLAASGTGVIYQPSNRRPENFYLIDDPTAPHGKGRTLVHRLYEGQPNGSTAGTFHLFHPKPGVRLNDRTYASQVKLKSYYRSFWYRVVPDPATGDFQFGSNHERLFWPNQFWGWHGGSNGGSVNVSLRSPGWEGAHVRHDYHRGIQYWMYRQSGSGISYVRPYDDAARRPLGAWHHVEQLVEILNDPPNYGEGEAGMNEARIRTWVDGVLLLDDNPAPTRLRAALANDAFAMVWLGNNTSPRHHPRADVNPGRWTDASGGTANIYTSINTEGPNDGTYVQSPLSPDGAAYAAEWQFGQDPKYRPAAHRTYHDYRFRKSEAGGQRIDIMVEVTKWNGSQWEVVTDNDGEPYRVMHVDIGATVVENTISTASRNPFLEPGRYALRFTASAVGNGDARRAEVAWARFRTTHSNTRTQDDFIQIGDIYISGEVYED